MNLYEFYQAELTYGTEAIANDQRLATHLQEILIWLGFLDPPADGNFGPIATQALLEFQEIMIQQIPEVSQEKGFLGYITAKLLIETSPEELPQPPLILSEDLASRIIKYMQYKDYQIATEAQKYNIIYVEGMDKQGKLNDNQPNLFNDIRLVIECQDGKPEIIGYWEATTEPGYFYTYNPSNEQGAARIAFGQYKAWRIGTYGVSEPHEALLQATNIKVHRDFNKDMKRTGDNVEMGLFNIHQHWGYDLPYNNIGMGSTGSLVGRFREEHKQFMEIIKQDKRYQKNPNYLFLSTIISGEYLEKQFPRNDTEALTTSPSVNVTTTESFNQEFANINGVEQKISTIIETPDQPLEFLPKISPELQENLIYRIVNLLKHELNS